MPEVFFDWSHGGINVLFNDDPPESQVVLRDLFDLLKYIDGTPHRIVGEATFESFHRETRRNDFIRLCEAQGHELLTIPNRATGHFKGLKYGDLYANKPFPDDLAVDLIRDIARGGVHLKRPRVFISDDEWSVRRQEASRALMLLRNTRSPKIGRNGRELKGLISAKDQLAIKLINEVLPPYKELDADRKRYVGNGKEYSKVLVALTAVAAQHVDNRREFDKLIGDYHHGYPNLFRSDFMFHVFRHIRKREGLTDPRSREWKQGLSGLRRETRWMYHVLNGAQD